MRDDKIIVNYQHFIRLRRELLQLNEFKLENITWTDDSGKIYDVTKEDVEYFRLTGLNNCDFAWLYDFNSGGLLGVVNIFAAKEEEKAGDL